MNPVASSCRCNHSRAAHWSSGFNVLTLCTLEDQSSSLHTYCLTFLFTGALCWRGFIPALLLWVHNDLSLCVLPSFAVPFIPERSRWVLFCSEMSLHSAYHSWMAGQGAERSEKKHCGKSLWWRKCDAVRRQLPQCEAVAQGVGKKVWPQARNVPEQRNCRPKHHIHQIFFLLFSSYRLPLYIVSKYRKCNQGKSFV